MIIESLYNAIRIRLMETKAEDVQLKHFDFYTDQLDQEKSGSGKVHTYPAAFVRFNPIQWTRLGEGRRQGSCEFFVVVADTNKAKTAHKDHDLTRNKALQSFTTVDQVTRALDGWNPTGIESGTITCITTDPVQTLDGVISHVITFKCRVHDDIALKQYTEASPTLQATIDLDPV